MDVQTVQAEPDRPEEALLQPDSPEPAIRRPSTMSSMRSLYTAPVLGVEWNGDAAPVYDERSASWWELFVDLLVVVAFTNIADSLKEDESPHNFLVFLAVVGLVQSGWILYTQYTTRFLDNSLTHSMLLFGFMLGLAGLAIHAGDGQLSSYFSISMIVQRVALLLMYISVAVHSRRARPHATFISCGLLIIIALSALAAFAAAHGHVAAAPPLSRAHAPPHPLFAYPVGHGPFSHPVPTHPHQHMPHPVRDTLPTLQPWLQGETRGPHIESLLTHCGDGALPDEPFRDTHGDTQRTSEPHVRSPNDIGGGGGEPVRWTPHVLAIWALILVLELPSEAYEGAFLTRSQHLPINIDHVTDRQNAFILVALGESVLSCMIKYGALPASARNARYVTSMALALLMAFSLALMYYHLQPPRHLSGLRRSRYRAYGLFLCSVTLVPSLLLVGVAVKHAMHAVIVTGGSLSMPHVWMLFGALAMSALLIFLMRVGHYGGVEPRPDDSKGVKKVKYLWWLVLGLWPVVQLGCAVVLLRLEPRGVDPLHALAFGALSCLGVSFVETAMAHWLTMQ